MLSSYRSDDASPIAWLGFAAMALGMFMAILDIQIVATSLPAISSALEISPDRMSWIQTAYLIAEVISIPLTGWLIRALTFRWLFILAISGFTLASAGCAASSSFATLTAWRVLQGFCGGTLIPMVFSAVFLLLSRKAEGLATTIAGILAVLAPTLGPVVGGWTTTRFSWNWLFLINILPGFIALLVGTICLPRHRSQTSLFRTLDWISVGCIAIALAALEIGLKEAPKQGWLSGSVLPAFGLCAVLGTAFTVRMLRSPRPLVNLALFADDRFAIGCSLSFLLGIGLYGSVYLMPVFLALVRGHASLQIGLIMLVTGSAQLVAAPLTVWIERRGFTALLATIGFTLFCAGLWLSTGQTPQTDFASMFWPQVVRGSAIMLCILPPTRLALEHLDPEQVLDASSLFNLMRNLGGAIGIALIDTVIWSRVPEYGQDLVNRLKADDRSAAVFMGLSPDLLAGPHPAPDSPLVQAFLRPLVEKAALTLAINEAWLLAAAFALAGALLAGATVFRERLKAGQHMTKCLQD
ncbi:DHA2 family efflux MFS transporter permease subunit [Microvirga rosea]|uniref:DHA2 family efflux MFS transporter permease subunit n=1 Tax=Microvirga rosea TaxID=2715425 RepID=UPI001D0A6A4F|nr:DHA2 family efflux MFS transporter permease subunit [Microvirga rosea]MCB8822506.1 DHA2 family efflux MFS transporter permease subunit [Microvirga rosea]